MIVTPPEARLDKTSSSPSGTVGAGATLTYTLSPSSPGPTLLNGARIFDTHRRSSPPTFPAAPTSAGHPVRYGGSIAAVDGTDAGPGPASNVALSAGTTPFTVALGDTVTVTMVLTNNDPAGGFPITGVVPSALVPSDQGTTCSAPSPPTVASIAVNGGAATITYTCTIGSRRARSPSMRGADGTYNGAAYSFAVGTSNTVLGVGSTTGTSVITCGPAVPNSNTARRAVLLVCAEPRPGSVRARRHHRHVGALRNISTNTWIGSPTSLSNLPGAVGNGGALVYDGLGSTNGYVYAFQGGLSTAFWRYKISTGLAGSWEAVASTPAAVGPGGALAAHGDVIYALQGSSNAFWRYDAATNLWTVLSPLPAVANAGPPAPTSAGPFIYALRGNNTNKFYRYNPATDTWVAMPNNSAGKAKAGSALIAVGGAVYSIVGGTNHLARFVPNVTTGKWTNLKNSPGNFNAGASLTTDGTNVWALKGGGKVFWTYSVATNTWNSAREHAQQHHHRRGTSLAWVPATEAAGKTRIHCWLRCS